MRGPSCRAFMPLQKFPSFLSLAAGRAHSPRTGCLGPPSGRHVRAEKQGAKKKPPQLFPSEFHDVEKIARSGRKHIQGAEGRRAGFGAGAEDQNKFPTARKGRAGRAAAVPGGPSRIARGSGRARFLLKFRFAAPFTPISRTNHPRPRLDRKRCLPPWTTTAFAPSRNNRARVWPPASGSRGWAEVGGQSPGLPETAAEGRCARRPLLASGVRSPLRLLLSSIPAARSCLR